VKVVCTSIRASLYFHCISELHVLQGSLPYGGTCNLTVGPRLVVVVCCGEPGARGGLWKYSGVCYNERVLQRMVRPYMKSGCYN